MGRMGENIAEKRGEELREIVTSTFALFPLHEAEVYMMSFDYSFKMKLQKDITHVTKNASSLSHCPSAQMYCLLRAHSPSDYRNDTVLVTISTGIL